MIYLKEKLSQMCFRFIPKKTLLSIHVVQDHYESQYTCILSNVFFVTQEFLRDTILLWIIKHDYLTRKIYPIRVYACCFCQF